MSGGLRSRYMSFIDRKIGRWRDFDFFLDPVCDSGFGDRLIEIWAVLTIAELLNPGARTAIRWTEEGFETPAFITDYAPLFSVGDATFVNGRPLGAARVQRGFSNDATWSRCVRKLPAGPRQIGLRRGRAFGWTDPQRLRAQARRYGLPREMDIRELAAVYRRIAASTAPAPEVAAAIPADIDQRIGIHVRLSDKIVTKAKGHEMTVERWKTIEAAGTAYIDRCVAAGEKIFVCSEDTGYRESLMRRIRERGGDVIFHDPARGEPRPAGFDAFVDFFALARCRRIVQLTRYSNFSLLPAIISGRELVNFDPADDGAMNSLDRWADVATIRRAGSAF